MRDEPDDLPKELLLSELATHWGIEAHSLEYAPIGAGSYHWLATGVDGQRWFVTADRLYGRAIDDSDPDQSFAGLRAAYETAHALSKAGLGFVVAPQPNDGGAVVGRVLPNWAVAVFPHIDGQPCGASGRWTELEQQLAAAGLIAQLHAA